MMKEKGVPSECQPRIGFLEKFKKTKILKFEY